MEIRVLGAAGGEASGLNLTGFAIGRDVVVDGGTLGSRLTLAEQLDIRHVLLTHAHLDHVHALPFLLDNLIGRVLEPVRVYSEARILESLHQHIFNDAIWPDFTRLPTPEQPVVVLEPVTPGQPFQAGGLTVEAVTVAHSFAALGYLITDADGVGVVFSGDTGPSDALWQRAAAHPNLKAVFVECSFGRDQKDLAALTRHLSVADLPGELAKLNRPDLPVYVYHLKPGAQAAVREEIQALQPWKVQAPETGDLIRLA